MITIPLRCLFKFSVSDPRDSFYLTTTKGNDMTPFEFSDDFDAQGWYTEQMMNGKQFDSPDDPWVDALLVQVTA
jgi:hypothetical protein